MWREIQPDIPLARETHHGRDVLCFAERPRSLYQMFSDVARNHPDNPALIGDEGSLSHGELLERSARIASGLAALGLEPGARVALLMGNRFAFTETFYACFTAGFIAVPINPLQRAPEMAFTLNQCGATALVYDAQYAANLPEPADIPSLEHRISAYGGNDILFESLALEEPHDPVKVDEDETAVLLYTSGTTGRPKGAMLTHLSIIHGTLHFLHGFGLQPTDRMLLAAPASHVTGLIACLTAPLSAGAAVVHMGAFKAQEALKLIETERLTHTMGPPAIYSLMLLDPAFDKTDKSSWRLGGFGGAPMAEATIAELAERAPGLGLMNGYGASEATSPQTFMPPWLTANHAASVGHIAHCAEITIRDDEGRAVADGESGEIWMKGPNVVPGYWQNPEANAANFSDGWWKSGDIGRIDTNGLVYVHDRKKDMLNRGGYKIYSAEVENELSFHPEVQEVAIIAKPCPVMGERVRAVIVPSASADEALADDIRAFAAARLSKYKVPEDILFRDTPLPRNPNGKVMKNRLREEYPA